MASRPPADSPLLGLDSLEPLVAAATARLDPSRLGFAEVGLDLEASLALRAFVRTLPAGARLKDATELELALTLGLYVGYELGDRRRLRLAAPLPQDRCERAAWKRLPSRRRRPPEPAA